MNFALVLDFTDVIGILLFVRFCLCGWVGGDVYCCW